MNMSRQILHICDQMEREVLERCEKMSGRIHAAASAAGFSYMYHISAEDHINIKSLL